MKLVMHYPNVQSIKRAPKFKFKFTMRKHTVHVEHNGNYGVWLNDKCIHRYCSKVQAKRILYEETGLRAARRRAMVKSWKAWDGSQRGLL